MTAGAALVNRKPVGNDSVNPIPLCAGFEPVLVSVNTSMVGVPSAIDASPHDLVNVAFDWVTTKHRSIEVLVRRVVDTFVAKFVNAGWFGVHVVFVCVATLVSPATVTVQVAVPMLMAMPVSPDMTRVEALY